MSRRNPFSTGYVASKIRANSALRNGNDEKLMQSRDQFEESLAATDQAGLNAVMAALNYLADCAHEGKSKEQMEKEITGLMLTCARQIMSR